MTPSSEISKDTNIGNLKVDLSKAAKKLFRAAHGTNEHIVANVARFRATMSAEIIELAKRPDGFAERFEIIIPCYNHASYLMEAFDSVVQQTYKGPVTVAFVNDHSQDNSLQTMKDIAASRYPSTMTVKIIDNPINLNQAGSINKAIRESCNELFMILNADDILTIDCVELTLATYELHPEIYMLGGSSLWFADSGSLPVHTPKPASEFELTIYRPGDALKFTKTNDINMSQSSCSFLRVAWEVVGGYFERERRVCSWDDRDFQIRVCSVFPVGVYKDYPMEFYRTTSSTGRARS
jgi:GT2 family glycosyltransferase